MFVKAIYKKYKNLPVFSFAALLGVILGVTDTCFLRTIMFV